MQFPSLQAAEQFYHSAEYIAAREFRKDIAVAEIVALEGEE
ncbi:MAG: DUF1330 domain-containing protein [Gammaproteobacteria bacterium]|nr:DUF1330 domain-containing protein [Gammaproteobacteria bacterium]